MLGAATTVKLLPALAIPETVTTTLPLVAPVGTRATMRLALQLATLAVEPLNVTVLVPGADPKFDPAIVTEAPTAPVAGDRLAMLGGVTTVTLFPLLSTALACTTIGPVVAPDGTGTLMLVALHVVGIPSVPLKVTVLEPLVAPKPVPATVMEVPTAPDVGERLLMLGAATTVKVLPLLAVPETLTTTGPVVAPVGTLATMPVALQLVTVAALPLNVTVLVPWLVPNAVPAIVTDAPIAPDVGASVAMVGAAKATADTERHSTTVNNTRRVELKTVDNDQRISVGAAHGQSDIGPHNDK